MATANQRIRSSTLQNPQRGCFTRLLAHRDNRPGASSACFHCRKDKHGSVATAMLAGGGTISAMQIAFAAAAPPCVCVCCSPLPVTMLMHVQEVSSSSPSSGPLRMVAKILTNRTSKQCGKVSQRNFKFYIRETGVAVL